MSSSSNYNAITNLTETVIDYLVVDTAEIDTAIIESLDCNIGVIDTLTSTTATLTSANIPTLSTTTGTITTLNCTTGNITTINSTTGTITTINSTTGTITTLNCTTGNITTINTNTIQANPISSTVNLYTTHTGIFTIGNTSNTNNLTINNNIILDSTKKVISNSYQPRNSNDAVSLLTEASTSSVITLGGLLATLTINPSTTMNGNLTMASSKNILLSGGGGITVSTTGKIACYQYNSTSSVQGLEIGATNTSSAIYIGALQTTGDIYCGHTTPASDSGTLFIQKNTTVASGKKITTPAILVSGLTASLLTKTDVSKNIISSIYSETTLPVSTPQQTALDLKSNIASPTFTGTVTTPALNISGISASLLTKTDASKNVISSIYSETTLPVSTPQQTALDLKSNISNPTFTTGITTPLLTFNGVQTASKLLLTNASKVIISSAYTDTDMAVLTLSNTFSGTSNTFSNTILVNTLTGTTTGSGISLFGTSTSFVDLGNSLSTSIIRLNQNTSLSTGKILRTPYIYATSTVADLYVGNQATDSGILYIELNTDLHSSRKLKLNNTTASKLLLTDASKNLVSSTLGESDIATTTNLALKSNIASPVFTGSIGLTSGDITISSGKLVNNTFQGTTAGSSINLFSLSTGSISIGGLSTGILVQDNILTAIGKSLTMTTSGSIINDIYRGISVGNAISLFSTTTAGITLGGASSGISLADNTTLATGKTLTLSTTGSILCPTYNSTSATQALTIGGSNTTASITIGSAITSGVLNFGNTSSTPSSGNGSIELRNKIKNTFLRFGSPNSSYTNISNGASLFTSTLTGALSGKQLSTAMYTNAPVDDFYVIETDANDEGSAYLMNGNCHISISPFDQSHFWVDEDNMTTANNWAWTSGFKIAVNGTITAASDRRGKRDIQPIVKDSLLDVLQNIQFVDYKLKPPTPEKEYKNGVVRKKYQDIRKGVIAQDVRQAGLPEVVERESENEYWAVNYSELHLYFNMGVQELIKRDKEKQALIDNITARLVRLEQHLQLDLRLHL